MLTGAQAKRLALRAGECRADGSRGLLARRAWRRLTQAGGRGDQNAIEAVWQAWLRRPDDECWELLARWRSPRLLHADACAAAESPGGDPAARAALVAFCIRRGLAPDDTVQRARFFVLTGQAEQRRALDPDGALLAAAYQAADPRFRAALREGLAGAGDLDLVRVVAGSGTRVADMTVPEQEYLTSQLADRKDWAGLWRLAQDLPLLDAAAAVRLIDERWRPDRQGDRDHFGLLAQAGPEVVGGAREAFIRASAHRVEVPGTVIAGALSARQRRVAVMTTAHQPPTARAAQPRWKWAGIRVHTLPDGTPVTMNSLAIDGFAGLLYYGNTLIAAVSDARTSPRTRVLSYTDQDGMELVSEHSFLTTGIAARRRGFVVASPEGILAFHNGDGRFTRTEMVGWPTGLAVIASERESGQVAVASSDRLILKGAGKAPYSYEAVEARLGSTCTGMSFHGPDHLITTDPECVRLFDFGRWEARQLTDPVVQEIPGAHCPVVIPARGEICVLDRSGAVTYLHRKTLARVGHLRELTGRTGTVLCSSPGNAWHALGGDGFIDVVTGAVMVVQALGDQPQAAWQLRDLAAVRRAAYVAERCPDARPWYDLMLGSLERKFGSEVRLARAMPGISDDEIGIS